MRKNGLFIAVGLLMVVNAIVLAGAAHNRSGEPDAVLTMTEREMPVAYSYQQENSGISLSILTHHQYYSMVSDFPYDSFAWLNRKKLASLGFDLSQTPVSEEQYDYDDRQLPQRVWAVLEYDGQAWEEWKRKLSGELVKIEQAAANGKRTAQELEKARKDIERMLMTDSHLFIVDAGTNPVALRQQYPDRQHHMILPAKVHMSYINYRAKANSDVHGYVNILISEVNVPHRLQRKLGEQKKQGDRFRIWKDRIETEPRYQVILHVGKRYEPWVTDVVPIK